MNIRNGVLLKTCNQKTILLQLTSFLFCFVLLLCFTCLSSDFIALKTWGVCRIHANVCVQLAVIQKKKQKKHLTFLFAHV